jgi:hypothetical protein
MSPLGMMVADRQHVAFRRVVSGTPLRGDCLDVQVRTRIESLGGSLDAGLEPSGGWCYARNCHLRGGPSPARVRQPSATPTG